MRRWATVAALLMLAGCGGKSGGGDSGSVNTFTGGYPSQTVPRKIASPDPTTTTPATKSPPAPVPPPKPAFPRPPIVQSPIPFGAKRKAEMAAYAERHYGIDTYRLRDPKVIVIHYTANESYEATYNTFAPDVPDSELHELPSTCAHFVVDKDGTIHQLVPLGIMCRHTVGLNWTSIGIEHVGTSATEVLDDHAQITASLHLVCWLRDRLGIATRNVIGHNESLSSPYHRERVAALRTQTHADWSPSEMAIYRKRLRAVCG